MIANEEQAEAKLAKNSRASWRSLLRSLVAFRSFVFQSAVIGVVLCGGLSRPLHSKPTVLFIVSARHRLHLTLLLRPRLFCSLQIEGQFVASNNLL